MFSDLAIVSRGVGICFVRSKYESIEYLINRIIPIFEVMIINTEHAVEMVLVIAIMSIGNNSANPLFLVITENIKAKLISNSEPIESMIYCNKRSSIVGKVITDPNNI